MLRFKPQKGLAILCVAIGIAALLLDIGAVVLWYLPDDTIAALFAGSSDFDLYDGVVWLSLLTTAAACILVVYLYTSLVKLRRKSKSLESDVLERTRDLRYKNLELLYREARLEQATRSARVGYWKADFDGTLTEISGLFRTVYGIPERRQIRSWEDLQYRVVDEDRDRMMSTLDTAATEKQNYEVEYCIRGSSRSKIYIIQRGELIHDEQGNPTGYSGTSQDITQERVAQLKLLKALEEAESANRSKSEFLANMSHELRTPLNAIIGFADSMQHEIYGPIKNDRYQEYIGDIHVSARHLLKIIGDILNISRIEAGRQELEETDVEVLPLLDRVLRWVRQTCSDRDIKIQSGTISDGVVLRADERQIRQVLLNVLGNSIKFTPDGGTISVNTRFAHDDFIIEVVDTGIGIPKVELEKVFEPFHQVGSVMTRKEDGAGLGLALSKSLMSLHNGTITIDSTVDIGTTVSMCFPGDRVVTGSEESAKVANSN